MRPSTRFIIIASWFLASALAWGQLPIVPADHDRALLARLSFTSTWVADYGDEGFPQICLSVDHTGHYRMRRLTTKGNAGVFVQGTLHPELLQGTLPLNQLRKLEKLLQDPDFRSLTVPYFGGLLRKGAETFVAEVPREDGVQRVVMSDADRENPFPRSADRIVSWLQHFKAESAEPLDVSAQDICPRGGLQPVHPATALLEPIPSSAERPGR
jgi:hypothetical protein